MPSPLHNGDSGDSVAISTTELKALSVPSSLLFMLGVEYDIFLCIKSVGLGEGGFSLVFRNRFTDAYRMLLEACVARFGGRVEHRDKESVVICDKVTIPLLRYVDYIPGKLHVDELLLCCGVAPSTTPTAAQPLNGVAAQAVDGDHKAFLASFITYAPFETDESLADVHGIGYYLTIDYGLALATHGHLVRLTLTCKPDEAARKAAIARFQKFTGWERFDLRFEDSAQMTGVVVFPSTQDASDVLDSFEDEESDTDQIDPVAGDVAGAFRLPFHLRPVASERTVPYIEDAALRRLRQQHWGQILNLWATLPANRNTVVVSNTYSGASLEEVLKVFDGLKVLGATLVEDDSPQHRRRAFVTFASSTDAKEALAADGRNTHGRALRIHIAPPYIDAERRGKVVASYGKPAAVPEPPQATATAPAAPVAAPQATSTVVSAPAPAAATVAPAITRADTKSPQTALNVGAREFVPKFVSTPTSAAAAPPPYTAPPPYIPGQSPSAGAAPPGASAPGGSPTGASVPPPYNLPPAYIPGAGGKGSPEPPSLPEPQKK